MSETELKNESKDIAKSTAKRAASQSSNSLKNKINDVRNKAKEEIAELKITLVPLKKEIRGKVYEINRRIKALNQSIAQNQEQIAELKQSSADSAIPPKFAIKLKKLDIKNHLAQMSVYEDILVEFNEAITELDNQFDKKVLLVQEKADKQIATERQKDIQSKKNKAEKAKASSKAALEAKRQTRQKVKDEKRQSSLAVLRQHLPLVNSNPVTDLNELPDVYLDIFLAIDQKFDIVNNRDLIEKLITEKSANKYFSVISQGMVNAIGGITPADLLVISFEPVSSNAYNFTLHTFKNLRIERLATQFGFVKHRSTNNLIVPVDLNDEAKKEAVVNDLTIFLADLADKGFCTHIFDARHNALFKVK